MWTVTRPLVLLLTETYPVVGEDEPFMAVEVRELAGHVDLVLIPNTRDTGALAALPAGVSYEPGFAAYLSKIGPRARGALRAVLHLGTYGELRAFGLRGLDPRVVAAVLVRGSRMFQAQWWLRRYLRRTGKAVVYSWWSSNHAYGAARAAHEFGVPSVSRIHGYELYPEQDRLGRIPFQHCGLAGIDAVYSVSQAGADYLAGEYPDLAPRVHVAYLGVDSFPGAGGPSTDGRFRILSCSSCVSVKRVELLAAGLAELAREHPELDFTWTHIGDGPTLATVRQLVDGAPGLGVRCTFTGALPPSEVRTLVAGAPFDAFVNVSSSEGLPVTLMEAASNGIPLIATSIGGNPEIVDTSNGMLLAPDPRPQEIARAILEFSRRYAMDGASIRTASRATWEARFSAEANYAEFAAMLVGLWSANA